MPAAYPLMLNVVDRLSVIIGGGSVALRKARGLVDAGATKIRMVAPQFHGDIPVVVEKLVARYESHHLEGAGLVFAATDSSSINDAVVREANRRGILVSRSDVDTEDPGDFTTPALSRHGPIIITVSTAGAPALAVMIRDHLSTHVDPLWCKMAEAMRILRPKLLAASQLNDEQRRSAFRLLATDAALTTLSTGGIESLWELLTQKFPNLETWGKTVSASQK